MENYHKSILLSEIIELAPTNGIVIDATLGGGGHSASMFDKLQRGLLVSLDRDMDAIKHVTGKYGHIQEEGSFTKKEGEKTWKIINSNFSEIKKISRELNLEKIDFVLADIGVSSYQIDENKRGFSYQEVGPLDMRMDKSQILTAKDLVNGLNKNELERIFREYGEERFSSDIAQGIVNARSRNKLNTTFDIVEIIKKSVGNKYEASKNPARRVFQALRIAVNNELGELDLFCNDLQEINPKSSVILTFHSLERNIVAKYFPQAKEILPRDEEIRKNSRAKSCIGFVIN